ncbi:MAG: glycogen debranching enzyme N-terminal domain-containing protein [Kiritimatiellae bacterium]|nr:glycogen debranching enzyme N-terminal domain-containing protein [Kiritimatiellia bacterium]
MKQTPNPHDFILKWRGDVLTVTLELDSPRPGRAAFRTNIGHARVRRREIIAQTETGETPLARAWTDIPLPEVKPGIFRADIPLDEVGVFSGKACFFPEGSTVPEWPEGRNTHIKVESSLTRRNNSIYTVFPRQFGSFREIVRRLPVIMDTMGFRLIQTLPPFPVPTTYAVMGEYGCPFAALDFLSVDPAMAEFDEYATPLDQFRELIDAVHARRGLLLVDLPANHTGWASALQTHHPDWFHREDDGRFISPGAWGVKWADLVELDYSKPELRSYMADVFLFWCRNGVDGFRCDAGYMIPAETWEYIVARVREEYPDTIFMLEGLGGDIKVTDRLLAESNLDWAYSELFQTYDRAAFEWYLPGAIARSETYGTLVHFAETHDNDRLAKGGETYARLRVQLAALLSWQGAWGIANGVEWFCKEKIDVHGKNDLNWGAKDNMVELISRLNFILETNPAFSGASHLEVVTRGAGNTLAVARECEGGGERLLVLANLDCGRPASIEWDLNRFPSGAAFDLMTEKKIHVKGPVHLAPGQVMCLKCATRPAARRVGGSAEDAGTKPASESIFHWVFPRDVSREVVVPEDQWVEVSAPQHFRMRVIDPATGKTLRVFRSADGDGRHAVRFDAPHYKGDGVRCRRLVFSMIVYSPGKAQRTRSAFLIPPRGDGAKAAVSLDGAAVRKRPDTRAILSNGAGAAAQLRAGWGCIASQYDAILAANPNPECPSDRLNLWTRMRCWLQREGYTREFDSQCVTRFSADPAGRFARWNFLVPCGMGKTTSFVFEAALGKGKNAARIKVTRVAEGPDDVGDQVRIVFRPDIEWRSFHAATKAYAGLEDKFPQAVSPSPRGFAFAPYGKRFVMSVENGIYHHEPQWSYNVGHPEEAARGQDPAGDLFSPGWISADLKAGDCVLVSGELEPSQDRPVYPEGPDDMPSSLPVADALKRSLDLFIVKRDDLKTVIAGYPWFLDWGRDTFIFMRGMIAACKIEESLKILRAFAAFEEDGTLPNIIYGATAGNRDTTDAQLWFIRCVQELEESFGLLGGMAGLADLKDTCGRIVDNYIKGTPNGIKMDPGSGLVFSPSHFTWMDTNYPACTPRTGYPVEIQALWISALRYTGRSELAERARASTERFFKRPDGNGYWDCLAAEPGVSAADAIPEDTIRPNQLLLVTLDVIKDRSILRATEELLVPGGIRSLDAGNPLYRGSYAGDEDTSRKPAYHNGTVWAWPFPLWAEALVKTGMASAATARQLLAGAVENLNCGCLCHISEIADGDAPHAQKGCTAQAWSDSELLRVWLVLSRYERFALDTHRDWVYIKPHSDRYKHISALQE